MLLAQKMREAGSLFSTEKRCFLKLPSLCGFKLYRLRAMFPNRGRVTGLPPVHLRLDCQCHRRVRCFQSKDLAFHC